MSRIWILYSLFFVENVNCSQQRIKKEIEVFVTNSELPYQLKSRLHELQSTLVYRLTSSAKPRIKGIYRRESINGKLLFRNENDKSQLRYDTSHRYWIVEILRYDHRDAAIVEDDPDQNLVLGVFHTSLEKIYNHELNTAFESIERRRVSIWVKLMTHFVSYTMVHRL